MIRTALLQHAPGFTVTFSGLDQNSPRSVLTREDIEAEIACDVMTAEEGRGVHRGPWYRWPTVSIRTCKFGSPPIPDAIC